MIVNALISTRRPSTPEFPALHLHVLHKPATLRPTCTHCLKIRTCLAKTLLSHNKSAGHCWCDRTCYTLDNKTSFISTNYFPVNNRSHLIQRGLTARAFARGSGRLGSITACACTFDSGRLICGVTSQPPFFPRVLTA